jgi:hypothetical protein
MPRPATGRYQPTRVTSTADAAGSRSLDQPWFTRGRAPTKSSTVVLIDIALIVVVARLRYYLHKCKP